MRGKEGEKGRKEGTVDRIMYKGCAGREVRGNKGKEREGRDVW